MRKDVITLRDTAGFSLRLALLIAALGWACDSPSSPSPPTPGVSPPPPSGPPPSPTLIRYHVSGVVTDETGSPVTDAVVAVDYSLGGGGFSSPPATCHQFGCWTSTRSNGGGSYDLVFEPGPGSRFGANGAGIIYSVREGYADNIQVLPRGAPDIVQNLRLRRVRPVNAGQSITVSIEPDSSLCSDLEDLWLLTSRCENVAILVGQPGTLTVEARATETGDIIPIVFFATSGQYTTPQVTRPGTASVGVQAGERYRVFVGTASGTAASRYDVSTSLR